MAKKKTAAETGMEQISLSRADVVARTCVRVIKLIRAALEELQESAENYLASRPKYAAERGRRS